MRPRRTSDGKVVQFCSACSDTPEAVQTLVDDEEFLLKLKNMVRQGRAEKPLRSLARNLSIPELRLHEVLKGLDDAGNLPYGYYDKIEKLYVRTHLTDDIPPELMIDMIKQSFGWDIFGAKMLANYISLGRYTTTRKVLKSLHGLRKKGLLRGYKRGARWLWRLPKPGEDPQASFFPPKKEKPAEEEVVKTEDTGEEGEGEGEEEEEEEWDEEEEQDDSKMVYFADPEADDED